MKGWLSEEDYKKLEEMAPILTVDIFIKYPEGYLWIKRKKEPEKNMWASVGGRVFKNETLVDACKRIAKREVGVEIDELIPYTFKEYFDKDRHTVSIFFTAKPKNKPTINKSWISDFAYSFFTPGIVSKLCTEAFVEITQYSKFNCFKNKV